MILNGRVLFSMLFLSILFFSSGCQEDDIPNNPKLIFKMRMDPNQVRLDNFGMPAVVPSGNAAQSPEFNTMGVHYIEMSQGHQVAPYQGERIFQSPMTTEGGNDAIDFDQALYAGNNEVIYSIDLSEVSPGSYEFLRMSLSYQNYTVDFRSQGLDLQGTIASFIGSNTFIRSFQVKDETVAVNGNRKQGYWAFETDLPNVPVIDGQAPPGATTVPNPISDSSPIPAGSCLVTGQFEKPLVITGNERSDIEIICSVSTNNSFEWEDLNQNNIYEPSDGDKVVNMGVRGLIPLIE